jgi:hypothetical protein
MYCMTQNVVTHDEAVTGSKHLFLSISNTLEMYITNITGNIVLVPISTHPTVCMWGH